MAILTIPQLPSTTPTLAETMRACLLNAGLSRAQGSRAYVLANPKAWLGTAYHEVLEALPALAAEGMQTSVLQRAEARWNQTIARLEQQAASHTLNQRFGSAITWKGYYLVLETLRIRVSELAESLDRQWHRDPRLRDGPMRSTSREDEFSALAGKLRGRIDLVQGDEIIDYKTGALFENDLGDAAPSLKQAYVRQLRIYAYLVQAATGQWPRRGLLFPLAGAPVVVNLEPAECETEATETVRLLDRYNSSVGSAASATALGSPSPEACRWCPFKTICPAFWTKADESWTTILDGEAVSGLLSKPPLAVHGGAAWSIGLMVEAGTMAPGEVVISPLSASVHSSVPQLCQGERVRIVGLGRRNNGSLFPTQRTVVLAEAGAPGIQLGDPITSPEPSEARN